MLNLLLTRWLRPATLTSRDHAGRGRWQASINPPALYRGDSFFQTLRRWIPGEADAWDATGPARRASGADDLPLVRARFIAQLEDIHSEDVEALLARIKRSRSLRDLWHLRPALFNMVARSHDQTEAERRMTRLNPLFPGRRGGAGNTRHPARH